MSSSSHVVELAKLRLQPDTSLSSVLPKFKHAKEVMEKYSSGHSFYFLQQLEDPSILYIQGAWPSVEFHREQFLPSPENQQVLRELKDDLTVEWMFHIDMDAEKIPIHAHTLAVVRHIIKPGEKDAFKQKFEENVPYLSKVVDGKLAGGWRIDKDNSEEEEWVLFTHWNSREEHAAFGNTEGFMHYGKIRDHLTDGTEVRHAKVIDL